MRYLITIPASITKGKKPTIIPEKHMLTEAFNQAQAERRASSVTGMNKILPMVVGPGRYIAVQLLDEWIAKIDTI